jgi:hypothetical protein
MCHVMISHTRPSEGPSTQPLSSEAPSTQPISSAPVVRRSVLETPHQYLRRRMSYTKHTALKLGANLDLEQGAYLELPSATATATASHSGSGSHSGFDSEEFYGRRSNKRALRASSDIWAEDQNQNEALIEDQNETGSEATTEVRGEREAGEGEEGVEGDKNTPVWQRYQDLTSVDVQLEDTGTNFASVGLNYTITFIIQSYGEWHCDDYEMPMLCLHVCPQSLATRLSLYLSLNFLSL